VHISSGETESNAPELISNLKSVIAKINAYNAKPPYSDANAPYSWSVKLNRIWDKTYIDDESVILDANALELWFSNETIQITIAMS
jgi:hypothetical protein